MPITTTGAQFKAFYNDPNYWDETRGTYHDDVLLTADGVETEEFEAVSDSAVVVIDGGFVTYPVFDAEGDVDFEDYFKHWLAAQTTTRLVVECTPKNIDAVKAAILAAGGKVLA